MCIKATAPARHKPDTHSPDLIWIKVNEVSL